MPRLANQSFSALSSYERSAMDNGECSVRWRAEPAQGQDDPVEYTVVPACRGILKSWTHQSYVQLFDHFAGVPALGQPLKKEDVKSLTL